MRDIAARAPVRCDARLPLHHGQASRGAESAHGLWKASALWCIAVLHGSSRLCLGWHRTTPGASCELAAPKRLQLIRAVSASDVDVGVHGEQALALGCAA